MGFKTDYVDVRLHRYCKGYNIHADLLADLEYEKDENTSYVVPAGFDTDFASIPKLLWWLFYPIGKWTNAAILHDWFYRGNGVKNRKEADDEFYNAGLTLGVNKISMWIMWFFVRCFAWFAYTTPEGKKGKIDTVGIIAIVVCVLLVLGIVAGITIPLIL